ncbi:MAG: RNA-binding protein [Deltaproteobacteria bacterium]|nr:RNA-binding protein [Deltaproteobacteria bacterium]
MNIFVGNLSYDLTEEELSQAFEQYGELSSVKIIKNRFNGKSRGFGFVEFEDEANGQTAIDELNGQELKGRPLRVDKARPKRS